jgi:TolA-binding protein
MEKTLKLMVFALLAFGLFACGETEKKLTYYDLKEAEKTLFNADQSLNEAAAPEVADKYCLFVEQNPKDSLADEWLYHALEINVMMKDVQKSETLCDQLLKQYPQSHWAPVSLFLMGNYIYDGQLNDTAKAHIVYQRLIDEYPDSKLVDDAQKSIEFLGWTPDQIMNHFMMSQYEDE